MHCKGSLILAYASLAMLANAAPQSNVAATGAVAKSTLTQTKVATATLGGPDPAAATGGAGVGTGSDVGGTAGAYDTTGAGTGVGVGSGAGGAGVGGASGAGTGTGAAGPGPSSGGMDGGMPPSGSGPGAGMSGSGLPDGKGFPGGGDWEQFAGKGGPGGDKGPLWAKFSGSNGHPHQPVARGWSGWFSGGAGKDQGGEKEPTRIGMKHDAGVASQGPGRMVRARRDVVTGGPSWAHVRDGVIGSVKVARSMPVSEQGKGGMSYSGERQGGSRWGGYGQR